MWLHILSSSCLIILCDHVFALKGVLKNDNNNIIINNNNEKHADRNAFNLADIVKVLRSSLSTKLKQSFELSS